MNTGYKHLQFQKKKSRSGPTFDTLLTMMFPIIHFSIRFYFKQALKTPPRLQVKHFLIALLAFYSN